MSIRSVMAAIMLSAGLIAAGPTGCASAPELTVNCIDHNQTYRQGFTHAYINRNDSGDFDVVLTDDPASDAKSPATKAPVRQIMHIRIVWAPTSDMKAIVSNASVKWLIIGRSPGDVLQYSGIAFVSMKEGDDNTTLRVQNALLKPSPNHGTLTDPIGPARLEGTFVAQPDRQRVTQLLAELKTALASASKNNPSRAVSATN